MEDDLLLYCKSLPKVELHAHLNGSISNDTMYKLLERKRRHQNEELPKLWQTTIEKGQKRTLEECFEMFKMIHQTVDNEEAVSTVASDVVKEFAADGVVYLELRSTPRANPKAGMTKALYIDAMIEGVKAALDCLLPSRMFVRILLSIDRSQSVAEAEDTVLLAEKYSKMLLHSDIKVVGVDLSGNPCAGDVTALLPVLKSIKEKNLKFAAHLSEIPSQNAETLLVLMEAVPNRIGHGTFMHPNVGGSEDIVKKVKDSKIPIEVCLSSNLKSNAVTSLDRHHMRFWKQNKHAVVVCTDDKGVFSTSLSEEYCLAARHLSLNKQDLWQLSLDAVNHIFEDDATKAELRLLWHKK